MQIAYEVATSPARHDRPFDRFGRTRHFGSLDALRAVAVLAVVWHHAGGDGRQGILGHGFLGVELFFVISGFLITTLLLRERDRSGISLKKFYMRRSLRIFPLYYATLALYVLLIAFVEGDAAARAGFWDNLPAFATYTFNWFSTIDPTSERVVFYFAWSLATEEQFYLLWPPLLARLSPRLASALIGVATVSVFLLGLTVWTEPHYGDPLMLRVARSVPFALLLGVCLGLALHDRRSFERVWPVFSKRGALPLSAAAALGLLALGAHGHLVVLALAGVVASAVITEDHPLVGITRFRPLVEIGKVSYGIYLLHSLTINGIERIVGESAHAVVTFALAVVASVAVAQLSFHLFERPFLRLKGRYAASGGPADI